MYNNPAVDTTTKHNAHFTNHKTLDYFNDQQLPLTKPSYVACSSHVPLSTLKPVSQLRGGNHRGITPLAEPARSMPGRAEQAVAGHYS